MCTALKSGQRPTDNGSQWPRPARGYRVLDDLPQPVLVLDTNGCLRFANRRAVEYLGLTSADFGADALACLGTQPSDRARIERRLALLRSGRVASVRIRIGSGPAARQSPSWQVSAHRDARGRPHGFLALAETLPLLRRLERRVALSEQRLADFTATSPDWFWETDARHRFSYLSERIETVTGMARADLLGRTRIEIMGAGVPPEIVDRHAADLAAMRPFQDLTYDLGIDGSQRSIRVSGRPVFAEDGQFLGYRGTGWEVGGPVDRAARESFLVRHDPLTGLVNRQALSESLAAALSAARRSGGGIALFVVDLAEFKQVNDGYGHRIGDQLLQKAAARLRYAVARTDTVARLGADEFAIVMILPQPTPATAIKIGERVAERLRRPFGIEGHEIHCGVRVGITLSPLHGTEVEALLQQADLAVHQAKRHDQGLCFFGAELSAASRRRKSIEEALRRALERDEMSLVLQPQFAVADQQLVGCEALLRWRHGHPDEVSPGVFVPIAEESGLIVPFGSWVLQRACSLAARWWQGGAGPRIAINLSPVQFWNRDLCREVADALATAKLPPTALELEITEGVLMRDTESAARTLNQLNELGVAIALDDFGTGYSSLSYLERFPIHRLKIDQTFIRDLDQDADDRQIAKAIVGLGHSLDLEVVAEGVESAKQLAFLADLRCDVAQGYYFSPPVRVEAFEAALAAGQWCSEAKISPTLPLRCQSTRSANAPGT